MTATLLHFRRLHWFVQKTECLFPSKHWRPPSTNDVVIVNLVVSVDCQWLSLNQVRIEACCTALLVGFCSTTCTSAYSTTPRRPSLNYFSGRSLHHSLSSVFDSLCPLAQPLYAPLFGLLWYVIPVCNMYPPPPNLMLSHGFMASSVFAR